MGAVVIGVVFLAGTFALYGVLRLVLFSDANARPRGQTQTQGMPQTPHAAAQGERAMPPTSAPSLNGTPAAAGARARQFERRS
jgi:hypothetical protein